MSTFLELQRHELVWLDLHGLNAGEIHVASVEDRAVVRDWIDQGRPAVVRRRVLNDLMDVSLGIPLPLDYGCRRVALCASSSVISRTAPAPYLLDTIDTMPEAWRMMLVPLAERLGRDGVDVCAYGSLVWEWLTGDAYLHPQSDVDLLLKAKPGISIKMLLTSLSLVAENTDPRLDGELMMPGGPAVAWRELLTSAEDVLVKDRNTVSLQPRSLFLCD